MNKVRIFAIFVFMAMIIGFAGFSPAAVEVASAGSVIYVGNPLQDQTYASDFPVNPPILGSTLVVIPSAVLPDGFLTSFQTWNQANRGGSPFPSAGNVFHAYVLRPTSVADQYTVVFDSGLLTVPPLTDTVSEVATFPVVNLAVQTGDVLAFYGQGIPLSIGGSDILSVPAPTPPSQDAMITVPSASYPVHSQDRIYSFGAQIVVDTTAPDVTAALVCVDDCDDDEGKFRVEFSCSDACDTDPTITSATLNGIPVTNGQLVELEIDDDDELEWDDGVLQISASSFELEVTCEDASGNVGMATASPDFGGDDDDGDDDDDD